VPGVRIVIFVKTSVITRPDTRHLTPDKLIWKFLFPALPLPPLPKIGEVLKKRRRMANHKATQKDVRQAAKRRERNKYYGKTTRNAIRDLKALKDKKEAGTKVSEVASMIDKLAKKGIIHKKKAANLKSKLTKRVNSMGK
jgi:small subunit ribosomal protein S20